ncbi:MAG TPA: tyrosine-protein phosphatase [Acidimicrobiia bacterium]|nr:tyrosine-protein phosphatase [Acidimicrobiia bacterium]
MVTSSPLPSHPDRRLLLEKLFNFRDLGGYPTADGRQVRWRTLYRSDGFHRLGVDDLQAVADLGLKTVLDLRTPREVEEWGRFPVEHIPVEFLHLPFMETTWDPATITAETVAHEFLAARYLDMLETGAVAIARGLRTLADPVRCPAVFHCAVGKDRTGVMAAVVLALLGVSDADIADDYGLSAEAMERFTAWVKDTDPEAAESMARHAAFLSAPPEAVHGFLDGVRERYDSIEGYVASIGVDPAVVGRLRANLLAPPISRRPGSPPTGAWPPGQRHTRPRLPAPRPAGR